MRSSFSKSVRHYGLEQPKVQTAVLGHSLVRSLAPLNRSLAPRTRSLARSLRPLPRSWESELLDGYFVFFSIFNHSVRM